MGNELQTLNYDELDTEARGTDLAAYGGSGSRFRRRLTLVGKGSKPADLKGVEPGNWGYSVSKDEFIVLHPEQIDLIVYAVRPKVLQTNPGGIPISVYDRARDEYWEIFWQVYDEDIFAETCVILKKGEAVTHACFRLPVGVTVDGKEITKDGVWARGPDSTEPRKTLKSLPDSGCMEGPEFLGVERTTKEWYDYFCGNGSGRAEAKRIEPMLPVGAKRAKDMGRSAHGPITFSLKSKYVDPIKSKNSWWAPQVVMCSDPIDQPPVDSIKAKIKEFAAEVIDGVDEEEETKGRTK